MFGLIWLEGAMDDLADAYLEATVPERERMSVGVEALNNRLREEPNDEGESRDAGNRLTFVPLLSVLFEVSQSEGVVYVIAVQRYGR